MKNKELVEELTKEFDKHKGIITCEFALHKDDIDFLYKLVRETYTTEVRAAWAISQCKTCCEQHGKDHMHCELVDITTKSFLLRTKSSRYEIFITVPYQPF